MAAPSRATKRMKKMAVEPSVTSLDNPVFNANDVAESKTHTKMSFRSPVTIDNVFSAPAPKQVKMFYESRNYGTKNYRKFDTLPKTEKLAWTESYHDNKTLMGFIVYAMLFPKLLQTRIKLNAATYHWAHLDSASEKGRVKLEQRRNAVDRLKRTDCTRSVFMGLPYRTDNSSNILEFMNLNIEEEDERFRFFTNREFSLIYSERGAVGSSSVYASCSMALSLLWFATAILARPCCLESVILPISVTERQMMEQRFNCPPQFFDGAIKSFHTKWRDVFTVIDTHHRNIDYTLLEKASEQKYVEAVHIADIYAIFRATMTAPDDRDSVQRLDESYKKNSKHGVESGAVVRILDVIRDKPVEAIGKIDGGVLGTIFSTYGERACLRVQAECIKLDCGGSLFDDSVSNKLTEIMAHFDNQLWKARKKDKVERVVAANMDPAGINKKVEGQRMLDPTDPASVEKMMHMLKSISNQVWAPLKKLIGEALGASLGYPTAFLQISQEQVDTLHRHLTLVKYSDIANLYVTLVLSFSFQRSQVLRQATVDEFTLVPDKSRYKFSFKDRRFKTSTSTGNGSSSSALPVSHFILTPDQSMIVKFVTTVGHRFTKLGVSQKFEPTRRLLVNSLGENWTQKDIGSRYKTIGEQWLGIANFGPHVCRTFWSTYALHSGQIDSNNIEQFSSFLQVSRKTMENSYMSASGNSAAHKVGAQVLGSVSNAACTGQATIRGSRPYGKKLSARRFEFILNIKASLTKYDNTRDLFRALVSKRKSDSQLLGEDEAWFRWENTFFYDDDERLFQRFVDKASTAKCKMNAQIGSDPEPALEPICR